MSVLSRYYKLTIPILLSLTVGLVVAIAYTQSTTGSSFDDEALLLWNFSQRGIEVDSGVLRIQDVERSAMNQPIPAGVAGVIFDEEALAQAGDRLTTWYRSGLVIVALDMSGPGLMGAITSHPGAFAENEQRKLPANVTHPESSIISFEEGQFAVAYRSPPKADGGLMAGAVTRPFSPEGLAQAARTAWLAANNLVEVDGTVMPAFSEDPPDWLKFEGED